jgi:hypothetical protein
MSLEQDSHPIHHKLRDEFYRRHGIAFDKGDQIIHNADGTTVYLTAAERYQAFCEEKPWRWEARLYDV